MTVYTVAESHVYHTSRDCPALARVTYKKVRTLTAQQAAAPRRYWGWRRACALCPPEATR